MGIKSLMLPTRICEAQRQHRCKANKNHIISSGEYRLEIKKERSWDKYCLDCGNKIVLKLIEDSSKLKDEFGKYYSI
ncbi:hypothetical protein EM61_005655 [Vibrio parahaemolyticus]|uniref:Uncharacterized protein n=1 Tax=Vibrio parahaemolyticus TaxID=670 RepID=A0A0L8SMM9_VIBPH|nr:hypothetical protein A6J30_03345 [Vibrio parahaemolyticus]EQM05493.1 hypothetical protein D045_4974 [Vibrio parahaemolyticus VP-NY4]EVU19929.1 hypothetical protein D046_1190 [Vibrio parahaemolyticus V-223/04]RFD62146.1 hypothetical protein H325_000640 [Vibrio parahaemolyticus 863]RFD62979.1 hypothetical protein H322_004365 [Vibrio parahaemolyticus VP551]RFD69952.1 hypothetical protein H326_017315 [Vibrio parahaemolyticus 930]